METREEKAGRNPTLRRLGRPETSRLRETMESAAHKLAAACEKGSGAATRTCSRAIGYGRDHPRAAALVALGAGIGVGVLMGAAMAGPRRSDR